MFKAADQIPMFRQQIQYPKDVSKFKRNIDVQTIT